MSALSSGRSVEPIFKFQLNESFSHLSAGGIVIGEPDFSALHGPFFAFTRIGFPEQSGFLRTSYSIRESDIVKIPGLISDDLEEARHRCGSKPQKTAEVNSGPQVILGQSPKPRVRPASLAAEKSLRS